MNKKNIELYNRIIRSLDSVLNEALLDQSFYDTVKVIALCCSSLGSDSNLDLMTFGNEISLLFRLPDDDASYYYVGPNWNKCEGNELWRTLKDVNKVIGNVNWKYEGIQKIKSYPQPGVVVHAYDMSNNMYHYAKINSTELPIQIINDLYKNRKLYIKRCKGFSTTGVEDFIGYLVDEGLLDE